MSAIMDALLALPPWLILLLAFLLPAAEASVMVGMFIPGETAVIIAGVAANGGRLPLAAVIAAAVVGALIGDQIGFRVGRYFGPGLRERLPAAGQRRVGDVLDFVQRRGLAAVILGRWTATLRALVPGICGMSGMSTRRFTFGNVAGGVVWAVVCAYLGYLAGSGYHSLQDRLDTTGQLVAGAVVVAIVAGLGIRHLRPRPHEAG